MATFSKLNSNKNFWYLKSSDIKAYPTAYRKTDQDPESRVHSEHNLTNLGFSGNQFSSENSKNSYIASYDKANNDTITLKFILAGYSFIATYTNADLPAEFNNQPVYAFINIKNIELYAGQETTKLGLFDLDITDNDETYLDFKVSDEYYFIGLAFSYEIPNVLPTGNIEIGRAHV